jgi:hypothetical protein
METVEHTIDKAMKYKDDKVILIVKRLFIAIRQLYINGRYEGRLY